MAEKDARRVREVISEQYGFVPTLQYCADLIAFVEIYIKPFSEQKGRKDEPRK